LAPFPQHCPCDAASARPAAQPTSHAQIGIVGWRTASQIASPHWLDVSPHILRRHLPDLVAEQRQLAQCAEHGASALKKAITSRRAHSAIVSPREWTSSVFEALRDDATALGKLDHDLFVQPDIHLRRAVEVAFVAELLRELLASGKA